MSEIESPSDAENQESELSADSDRLLEEAMREKDSLPSEVSELIRAARAWRFDHGTWEALVAAIDKLSPDLV